MATDLVALQFLPTSPAVLVFPSLPGCGTSFFCPNGCRGRRRLPRAPVGLRLQARSAALMSCNRSRSVAAAKSRAEFKVAGGMQSALEVRVFIKKNPCVSNTLLSRALNVFIQFSAVTWVRVRTFKSSNSCLFELEKVSWWPSLTL